jgi:alcohol dehydrogenase class IV
MWFFKSPESYLDQLEGKRAFIVTDAVITKLGHTARVKQALQAVGFDVAVFDGVEPDPTLEIVRAGAAAMTAFQPDWVVGLGGGSPIDAAKAMWVLYERPDVDPEGISPRPAGRARRRRGPSC